MASWHLARPARGEPPKRRNEIPLKGVYPPEPRTGKDIHISLRRSTCTRITRRHAGPGWLTFCPRPRGREHLFRGFAAADRGQQRDRQHQRQRCPHLRNRSETAQVPPGETVQGDPGDPPGRSETPSGQPQQPLGGAGWLDWPAGTSRGRHAANRLKVVTNEIPLKVVYPPEPRNAKFSTN